MSTAAEAEAKARKVTNKRDADELADQVDAIRDDLQNLSSTVSRIAKGQVERAQSVAKDQLGAAQDKVYETAHEAEEAIRRNPLSAVAIAVGLGFLFGLLTRRG